MTGYAHPLYPQTLAEFGTPVPLASSGGWLLARPIRNTGIRDAMGPYPLFSCLDWRALGADLDGFGEELVSAVLVADPMGDHDAQLLESCFDHVVPFKTHYIVDLWQPGPYGTSQHRYRARKALREVTTEICAPSTPLLDEWIALYGCLIQRHAIRGIQAFSPESFRLQFEVPGLSVVRAVDRLGRCVGAQLWFVRGDAACYHLGAANERGYGCSCSYALYQTAIEHFRDRVRWLNLGGGAGCAASRDGLTRVKEGWSNASRTAYLCGRVLNRRLYEKLSGGGPESPDGYFPRYRKDEAR